MMNERADNVINFKTTARFSSVTQSMGAPVFNISGEDRAIWINRIFENSYASCKFILQPNRIKGVFQIEMVTCDYRARKDRPQISEDQRGDASGVRLRRALISSPLG
jgi:hypothetical protein